jgi:hypothetical protein
MHRWIPIFVTHGFSCARICSSGELDVQHLLKLLVAYNFLYGSPQKALHNLKTALSARSAKAWRAASGTAAKQRYGGVCYSIGNQSIE